MPDHALDALRKVQSIGVDPHPPPHPEDDWLGTAVQSLLGTMGLGDSDSRPNRFGQLLGAAIPLTGLPKVKALSGTSMVDDALEGLGHTFRPGPMPIAVDKGASPAAQAFVSHLNATNPGELDPMAFVRNSAVTSPHIGLPPQEIDIPKGFDVKGGHGYMPLDSTDQWADRILKLRPRNGGQMERNKAIQYLKETGLPAPETNTSNWRNDTLNSVRSPEELQFITHVDKQAPPVLSGRNTTGIRRGPSQVTDDMVREIRTITDQHDTHDPMILADIADEMKKKYGKTISLDTMKSIAKRTGFNWVK